MVKIYLKANPCKFTRHAPGVTGLQWWPMRDALAVRTVECKTAADVIPAAQAFAAEVDNGKSFFVSQALIKGQRAPAGYRQIPVTVVELDRDNPPEGA